MSTLRMRLISGTTSAYAENTCVGVFFWVDTGNYLRVRGEYSSFPIGIINNWELPPRTRRILEITATLRGQEGTTSAYAENTPPR